MFVVKRSPHNPIIIPTKDDLWRSLATFNWCPIQDGAVTHCVYRAVGTPELVNAGGHDLSTIGYAKSIDGTNFTDHRQIVRPEFDWEKYGCEDPRVGKIDGMNYIFYTALSTFPFGPEGIKIAVALTEDFETIKEKHLVTPFNAKAMCIFPERIGGKIVALLTAHTDMPPSRIALARFDKPEEMWDRAYWEKWHSELERHTLDLRRFPTDQVEIGAPPIKTSRGWLLIYSHIQNYYAGEGSRIFGIEALLLDPYYPDVIIGRTKGPILVPEEIYEKFGQVPNVVFPTGVLVEKDTLKIFYGASDTTCAFAEVNLEDLVESLLPEIASKYVHRFEKNPILLPIKDHPFESRAVFNPAAIELDGKIHILYRAMSADNTSTVGYAVTSDGIHIDERLDVPIYGPRESFEKKGVPGGNSGCEDPRIVEIDNRLYMTYTAYDGIHPPTVAITSIATKDFLIRNFNWAKPIVITPSEVDDKDSCLIPEKFNDKYVFLHRIGTDICADYFKTLDFNVEKVSKCIEVLKPRPGMWDGKKVGIAAPPIKTKKGWLLFYHGVSDRSNYRVGVALLNLKNPIEVIARTTDAVLMPEMKYEIEGQVPNVVFPCGVVIRKNTVFIYYGGGDSVVAVATMELSEILRALS